MVHLVSTKRGDAISPGPIALVGIVLAIIIVFGFLNSCAKLQQQTPSSQATFKQFVTALDDLETDVSKEYTLTLDLGTVYTFFQDTGARNVLDYAFDCSRSSCKHLFIHINRPRQCTNTSCLCLYTDYIGQKASTLYKDAPTVQGGRGVFITSGLDCYTLDASIINKNEYNLVYYRGDEADNAKQSVYAYKTLVYDQAAVENQTDDLALPDEKLVLCKNSPHCWQDAKDEVTHPRFAVSDTVAVHTGSLPPTDEDGVYVIPDTYNPGLNPYERTLFLITSIYEDIFLQINVEAAVIGQRLVAVETTNTDDDEVTTYIWEEVTSRTQAQSVYDFEDMLARYDTAPDTTVVWNVSTT